MEWKLYRGIPNHFWLVRRMQDPEFLAAAERLRGALQRDYAEYGQE
jgi:hypothetical protein